MHIYEMSEYYEIKTMLGPILEKAGLDQSEENMQLDEYGSAFSEYTGKGLTSHFPATLELIR